MPFVIIAILLALALLIVAGPVLEELIDRFRPPGTTRRRKRPAPHH